MLSITRYEGESVIIKCEDLEFEFMVGEINQHSVVLWFHPALEGYTEMRIMKSKYKSFLIKNHVLLVRVLRIKCNFTNIGFEASKNVKILRKELLYKSGKEIKCF